MTSFENNLVTWAESNCMFEQAGGVLLAVSGGADSVALAVALHRLVTQKQLHIKPVIGHINHTLRGAASDGDESFVRRLAEQLTLPFVCRRVNVRDHAKTHRLSIETAARNLRLEALTAMARDKVCGAVATGHHADDQAETVLHRLMRGTALRGLCGIRPVSVLNGMRFIRPLLSARRTQIEAYLRTSGLAWRQDLSNRSYAFTRNRIRLGLLPEIENLLPNATERLAALAGRCLAAQQRIEAEAESALCVVCQKDAVLFDRAVFVRFSPWVQAELLGRAVEAVGGGLRNVSSRHYQALMAQAGAETESKIDWPGGVLATVEKDRLMISKPRGQEDVLPCEPIRLEPGKTANFGCFRIETAIISRSEAMTEDTLRDKPAMTERMDADCIQGPLTVRKLEPGDRFRPLGLGHQKKAARFLLDSKADKTHRKNAFVVADVKKILYLAPLRLDERAKVTQNTRRILEIQISRLP